MALENESPSSQVSGEEDYEALYDSISNPNGDGPSQGDEKVVAAPESDKEVPPPEPEYEYTWSGQKIKAPLSEILKKAGMGHDYAQQTSKLHKERQEWQQKLSLSEKLKEQFGPVDEWVRSNPDKWEKLQAVIEAEKAGHGELDVNHPLYQKYQALEKQLTERILPKIEEQEQKEIRLKQQAEDKDLETEIHSIREKYKDLDWAKVSENGRSEVEMKVLRHASEGGFKTFRAAFLDLYHEDLEKRAEERGKSSIANDRLKQAKTGLLGKTQAPTQGLSKATNTKSKSYNDVAREAKEELGIQ